MLFNTVKYFNRFADKQTTVWLIACVLYHWTQTFTGLDLMSLLIFMLLPM